jgi:hypothetical protein
MAFTPSQKPTREWPLLVLALATVGTITVLLYTYAPTRPGESGAAFHKWDAERITRLLLGPEQIASYIAFTWAAFILLGHYLEVRRQRRAFGLGLLSGTVGTRILPEDAFTLRHEVEARSARGGPYILATMLRLALSKYAVSRSGRDVADTVRTQADVDLGRLVSGMATVHYLAWAIPAIGFLGTVRGLANAFTMGGRTGAAQIDAFMREATGHLDFAFDCTLVALALSLVLMFFLHSVQREEEALVIDCQQYCLEHLVTRLCELEPDAAHTVEGDYLPSLPLTVLGPGQGSPSG